MAKIILPIPSSDFDPTEVAVPWQILTERGHAVSFATPHGKKARADERILSGKGFGPWAPLMRANRQALAAYAALERDAAFSAPIPYADAAVGAYDGLLLPGGHAPGMKEYLESTVLQKLVAAFFAESKPIAAICHGVVVAARSLSAAKKSVLAGRKTTALLKSQELMAWSLTALWLKNYFRTYPQTVEDEVKAALGDPSLFEQGPLPFFRDSPQKLRRGFVVRDGNYLSARWPGDAHRFGLAFAEML